VSSNPFLNLDELTNREVQRIFEPYFDLPAARKLSIPRLAFDVVQIYGTLALTSGLIYATATSAGPIAALPVLTASTFLNARALRGAEQYVHEGSHGNVTRRLGDRAPWINDLVTDVLFSAIIAQTVKGYRGPHLEAHHGDFGGGSDPCKVMRPGLAELVLAGEKGPWAVTKTLVSVLPAYTKGYYREVGTRKRALVHFAAVHIATVGSLSVFLGVAPACAMWGAIFLLPFTTVLQAFRALGEAAEHDYGDPQRSEAAATYNNVGWVQRMFVNPFGDAYHWIHHMWPRVPSYRFAGIHRRLTKNAPEYRLVRIRRKVLEKA
jgi:fatty acid desaturase